jgi:hypothetical protein
MLTSLVVLLAMNPMIQEPTADNLKALCQQIHKTLHQQKDAAQAARLFQQLIPDEARLNQGLRSDIKPEHLKAILELKQKMGTVGEKEVRQLMKPSQSEVQVHASTTEELVAYTKDSVAYKEFPGGAQRLAQIVLKPKMTYYEVEYLEPGQDAGMKYHLFYWDGKQWSMLGPIWRAIR